MAKLNDLLEKLRTTLPAEGISVDETYRAGVAAQAVASLSKLRDAVAVFKEAGYWLETLTGMDFQDTAELVYHFNCFEPKGRVALRVLCGHDQTPASVCDIFISAGWLEREVHEMFGIAFDGNPDMRSLLLPEDADYHPLKKTFGNVHAYRGRDEIYG